MSADSITPFDKSPPLLSTQLAIAFAVGIPAFITFCLLRLKWDDFYAARRNLRDLKTMPPPLRPKLFAWIIDLWKITDEQVLECAGLDAFVFLGFFKMAIKFLATTAFFALTIIVPIRQHFATDENPWGNVTYTGPEMFEQFKKHDGLKDPPNPQNPRGKSYLWTYVFFVYFFTILSFYFLLQTTRSVSSTRQSYLGNQSTVTDRTIRVSGVPKELRHELKLKSHIESLHIGAVENVVICRQWEELDRRMVDRQTVLRLLEQYWTTYLKSCKSQNVEDLPIARTRSRSVECDTDSNNVNEQTTLLHPDQLPPHKIRPQIRLGFLGMRGKQVDAIDYYTVRLHRIDDAIKALRADSEAFRPTPLAFVSFRTVADAQLAAQAVLDPRPLHLVARLAPAPSDVIWSNTYLSRTERVIRNWLVFTLAALFIVLFVVPVGGIAALLNERAIGKISPSFLAFLNDHNVVKALTLGTAPTLVFTIFFSLVPFIFNYMSCLQGYISSSEVELTEISKNFAFIFFNYFVVFITANSVSNFLALTRDTTMIPAFLADTLPQKSNFFNNLIILQGIGAFPFRLLEFGTLSMYPFYKAGCVTPRDYSELEQAPTFNYAFYLPQPIFVYVICLIYSVMAPPILCFGLIFFVVGYFVYKYQLIYAMDHSQHSTGKCWSMIYDRVILGMIVFQLTMIGLLSAKKVVVPTGVIVPLPFLTLAIAYKFKSQFEPLSHFIALRAINRQRRESTASQTVDEEREEKQKYGHPHLYVPLEAPWTPAGRMDEYIQ